MAQKTRGAVRGTVLSALKTEIRIVSDTNLAAEGPSRNAMELAAIVSDCAARAGPSAAREPRFVTRYRPNISNTLGKSARMKLVCGSTSATAPTRTECH